MEEDAFLAEIAGRLSRSRGAEPRMRVERGVPEFHRQALAETPLLLAQRFKAELELLGGEAFIENGREAARLRLEALLELWAPERVLSWDKAEFEAFDLPASAASWAQATPGPAFKDLAMAAQLGVTAADFGIAQTGSLLLFSGPSRPRAASLCCARHLALLSGDKLVASMGEALGSVHQPASAMTFITGPSRTSDIENDSTIGVHGPAAVTVIIQL